MPFFLGVLLLVGADSAECLTVIRPPVIHAAARSDGRVTVTWRITGRNARWTLLLQRKVRNSRSYTTIGTYRNPKQRRTIIDAPAASGTYFYRARISAARIKTSWNRAVSVTITIPGSTPPPDIPLQSGQSLCPAGTTDTVVSLVNVERLAAGVPRIQAHPQLQWSARTHDIYMAASGQLSHDGWQDYIEQSGFNHGAIGENIAYGQVGAEAVMDAWMHSEGHRANILNRDFDYMGAGCIIDAAGTWWWVQNFGKWLE